MILSGRKIQLWITAILLALLFVGFNTDSVQSQALYEPAASHTGDAYYFGTRAPVDNSDWMKDVPDSVEIHELSLIGTHDTMAYECHEVSCLGDELSLSYLLAITQTLPLEEQLKAGVRVLDLRLGMVEEFFVDRLYPYHGEHVRVANREFDEAVLLPTVEFLKDHPTETVFMMLAATSVSPYGFGTLEEREAVFERYQRENQDVFDNYVWTPSGCGTLPCLDDTVTLGDARGKIVFLLFETAFQNVQGGVRWNPICGQGTGGTGTLNPREDVYEKHWEHIWQHFERTNSRVPFCSNAGYPSYYSNYLAGTITNDLFNEVFGPVAPEDSTGWAFPYWVAGGHVFPFQDSPPTTSMLDYCPSWLDQTCNQQGSTVTVTDLGMNHLAMNYINTHDLSFTGWVMTDFPGGGLIDAVISRNPNQIPQAQLVLTGCPFDTCYVQKDTIRELDASGSEDPDDTNLLYKWDLGGDGVWDIDWSDRVTIDHTFESGGDFIVEVGDRYSTSTDAITVIVLNVEGGLSGDLPDNDDTVNITPGTIVIREAFSVEGEVTDIGVDGAVYDTSIAWGDGTVDAGLTGSHFYTEPGTYTITFNVTITTPDGNGFTGSDEITVTVLSSAEATQNLLADILNLEDQGLRNSLSGKLEDVLANLEEDDTGSALGTLNAFINQLESQRGKKLTDEQVDTWSAAAAIIINSIEGDAPAGSGLAGAAGGGPVRPTVIGIVIAVLALGGLGMAAWSRFKQRNSNQLRS